METYGCQAHKKQIIHFTEDLAGNGSLFPVKIFNKLQEDITMYIQINPEYINAYFEKPIKLNRLIRIFHFEIQKRRSLKSTSAAYGIG